MAGGRIPSELPSERMLVVIAKPEAALRACTRSRAMPPCGEGGLRPVVGLS